MSTAKITAPKTCQLCGRERGEPYAVGRFHRRVDDAIEVRTTKGLEVCSACDSGLRSGTYAAVGVEHEARAFRNGHAFYIAPWAAKIFNRAGNTGAHRFTQGHAMTLAAILKAHAKHAKPLPADTTVEPAEAA